MAAGGLRSWTLVRTAFARWVLKVSYCGERESCSGGGMRTRRVYVLYTPRDPSLLPRKWTGKWIVRSHIHISAFEGAARSVSRYLSAIFSKSGHQIAASSRGVGCTYRFQTAERQKWELTCSWRFNTSFQHHSHAQDQRSKNQLQRGPYNGPEV
jgi:hypothetical protein